MPNNDEISSRPDHRGVPRRMKSAVRCSSGEINSSSVNVTTAQNHIDSKLKLYNGQEAVQGPTIYTSAASERFGTPVCMNSMRRNSTTSISKRARGSVDIAEQMTDPSPAGPAHAIREKQRKTSQKRQSLSDRQTSKLNLLEKMKENPLLNRSLRRGSTEIEMQKKVEEERCTYEMGGFYRDFKFGNVIESKLQENVKQPVMEAKSKFRVRSLNPSIDERILRASE